MRIRSISGIALVLLLICHAAVAADPDVERAMADARARAAAGDVVAQFSLGALLYYGSKDTAGGVEWIRKAAAQGYAPAEFQVAQLYDFGFGVAQDDRVARQWYLKAAGHGSAAAQRTLGDFCQKGRGGPTNLAEALKWYTLAAEGDDLRAQYALGNMYFTGTGAPRDYTAAYVWFTIAAGQTPLEDNRKAIEEMRNIAAARMTPAAIREAKRRVASWKPADRS